MKFRGIFAVCVFALAPALLDAQWLSYNILNPYPTANAIHGAAAPTANHLVGVTSRGEAIVTTDGGSTWHVDTLGNGIYRDVKFLDDLHGWAVGAGSRRLHKTTDGGFAWTEVAGTPDTTKYAIDFAGSNVGWAVGYNGFIIKTTDGGGSWVSCSVTQKRMETLYDVDAIDEKTVFVVGNDDLILKSTDGGSTWSSVPRIFSSSTDYRAVLFMNPRTGIVAGLGSRIARTTDGGRTWSVVHDPGGPRTLWSLGWNKKNVLLAVGTSSEVLRSTDGGQTWKVLLLPGMTTLTFYSVVFGSDSVAYIVGSMGALYKSTDGGAKWQ